MSNISSLRLENVGQIRQADITFGDLTVLVGPQATGKSVFLQFLRLVRDTGYIHDKLKNYGIDWYKSIDRFMDVYFGEGMRDIWSTKRPNSKIIFDKKIVEMEGLSTRRTRSSEQTVFYIPAQRVLSLANGWPRPFQAYAADDPFMVKDFSETFRKLMENELAQSENIFPKTKRLKGVYRRQLSRHIFGDFELHLDRRTPQKRLVLQRQDSTVSLPYMVWSAGQREFVPLLMGLYWLMPGSSTKKRLNLDLVVLEELEMGLHPNGISVGLLLIMELLWRGYKICLSTHSPHVLDVVWAIRKIQENNADPIKLLDIFDISKKSRLRSVAESVVQKIAKVYYFDREGITHDISDLDPGSSNDLVAGWGGLSEFSGRVADVVASVVNPIYSSEEINNDFSGSRAKHK